MTAAQLALRRDLVFSRQETGEGVVFVVKEPNSGRFFRIGEVEHFVARQFDGATPLDGVLETGIALSVPALATVAPCPTSRVSDSGSSLSTWHLVNRFLAISSR